MKTIIVHMSDEQWTMEAMHLASALARNVNGRIVLLHLVLANNPGLLGWEIAAPDLTKNQLMKAYATVAEDYGVEFCVQPMQFINFVDALAEATSLFDASVLFAHIPQSKMPLWQRFQLWSLKHQLRNCRLYTLDEVQPPSLEELIPSTVSDT